MDFDFKDQTILVTGGTGALGSKVSELFLNYAPKSIVITYKSENEKINTEKALRNQIHVHHKSVNGTVIEFIQANLLDENEVQDLVEKIIKKFGQIHVLANIVGGYFGGKSVVDIELREWERMMNMNLKSAFIISKHVLKSMKTNQFGKIVHVSSASGIKAAGKDSAYAASKAGLIRLVDSIKEEVKEFKININCILPTIIDTESNRLAMPSANYSNWVKPQDLAKLIVFLSSEDSSVINGEAIKTSGYA